MFATAVAAAARRSPGSTAATVAAGAGAVGGRQAAGAIRCKSAVASAAAGTAENVKNFKIYRWDPNEKVRRVGFAVLLLLVSHIMCGDTTIQQLHQFDGDQPNPSTPAVVLGTS